MTMQVSVTSPPTGGLMAVGTIVCGALRSGIEFGNPASGGSWNAYLLNRNELANPTAQEIALRPRVFHARPMDVIEYDTFKPLVNSTGVTGHIASDAMTPLVVSWGANATAGQELTLTLWTEWTCIYTSDPLLQSAAQLHAQAPESFWRQAIDEAIVSAGAAGALALSRLGGVGAPRAAARALPALMM